MATDPVHSRAAAMTAARRQPIVATRSGFTLVEVLLSLAILSIITVGLTLLLQSVSRATQVGEDVRRSELRREVLAERVDPQLRRGTRVLAATARVLVLWIGDNRPNSAIDLSELYRIEHDPGSKELRCYMAPATLTAAQDQSYADTTNFLTLTNGLAGTADFPQSVLAQNIESLQFTLDNASLPEARVVRYSFTIQRDSVSISGVRTTALRGE